jgi:hypothetical protein
MEIIKYTTTFEEEMIQIIIPPSNVSWNKIIQKIEEFEINGFININNNKLYLNIINVEIKKYNFTQFINWLCKLPKLN